MDESVKKDRFSESATATAQCPTTTDIMNTSCMFSLRNKLVQYVENLLSVVI